MGSIEVICGSMFSGKTEELIKTIQQLHIQILITKSSNQKLIKEVEIIKFNLTAKKVLMQLILRMLVKL